ncbi:MAG: Calx-beta domain-containing protein, partial [Planctomycetota bacterium]
MVSRIFDDYLEFTASVGGLYYIGISSQPNSTYDSNSAGSGIPTNFGLGEYQLQLTTSSPPLPRFNIRPVSAEESVGELQFDVTLSHAATENVYLTYALQADTAMPVEDYVDEMATLTFPPGVLTRTITVNIVNDSVHEQDEHFLLQLSNSSGPIIETPSVLGTILNDDSDVPGDVPSNAFTVQLDADGHFSTNEKIGDGLYAVADVDLFKVQVGAGERLTVDLDTINDSTGEAFSSLDSLARIFAADGTEVEYESLYVDPSDGKRSGTGASSNDHESSPTRDDFVSYVAVDAGEYFIAISSQDHDSYLIGHVPRSFDSAATSTVGEYHLSIDVQPATSPTVYLDDVAVGESLPTSTVPVRIEPPSPNPIEITVETQNLVSHGGATSGADYVALTDTFTIPANSESFEIPIEILDDSETETDELFGLQIVGISGALVGNQISRVTIIDDESRPISDVQLMFDTGFDDDDLVTTDPRITGYLNGNIDWNDHEIQIDHDGDGAFDGVATVNHQDLIFTYDPRVFDADFMSPDRDVTLAYQLVDNAGTVVEAWQEFQYRVVSLPMSQYLIVDVDHKDGKVGDHGHHDIDTGLTFIGRVDRSGNGDNGNGGGCDNEHGTGGSGGPGDDFNDGGYDPGCGQNPDGGSNYDSGNDQSDDSLGDSIDPVLVEIDLDMDGVPDAQTQTESGDQFFEWQPSWNNGQHTVQFRAVENSEEHGGYLYGAWTQYSFTWGGTAAPIVDSFSLKNDTGASASDQITADPTVIGQIVGVAHNHSHVTYEIDIDGDEHPDMSGFVDEQKQFEFLAEGLSNTESQAVDRAANCCVPSERPS